MAQRKVSIELEANTSKATSELEDLRKEIDRLNKEISQGNKETKEGLKGVEKASKATAKGVGRIGDALKAAGIGLAIAAFAKLTEVFNENQKVTNFFNTSFETLSLAFNDFFNFLSANIGTVVGYFQNIFSDPKQAIIDFGTSIKNNLIERFDSFLDTLGFLASAVKKVFAGDFAGALDDVKEAGKESVDILTGVPDTFDKVVEVAPKVIKGITDYAKSTIQAAKETVELNRAAEIGIAQNQIILAQKNREAELLRQVRDDESKTIEERIEANKKLAEVLNEQERLMLANADAVIAAAQAQFEKNKNDENQIALLEARAEREGILEQIDGFRSEQLININSLERERADLEKEKDEKAIENAEKLIELEEQKRQGIYDSMDAVAAAAGSESKIAKAIFLLKQGLILKEQILSAKATIARITAAAAESGVDGAKGLMKAAASAPPPANVPLIAIFAAQAAGIAMTIASAVNAAKSKIGSVGGGGGGGSSATSRPTPPSFNIVGASPESQLAQTIGEREEKPVKAYVVSNDVTTAQSLDRNIIESASI
jgi:hypothetical protein